ncbi:MAG: NYN domain-containing protein [bacterium]|nr:NYN domain-containing protein [bacterium]
MFRRIIKPIPKTKPKPNYAFIDSQNLNLGVQRFGWKLDWKKFREYLRTQYNVEKAYLFIGYLPENEDLYNQMQEAGYLVILKPTLEMYQTDEPKTEKKEDEKKPATKGNTDADLVLHAMKELNNYDKAIIVSGDGDFFSLLEYLQSRDKLLHLLAPNMFYSSLLKPFEKYIVRIDTFKKDVVYYTSRGKKHYSNKNTSRAK